MNKARELGYSEVVVNRLQEPFISVVIAAMKMIIHVDYTEPEKNQEIKPILNSEYLRNFHWTFNLMGAPVKWNIFLALKKRIFWGGYLLLILS